jgi:hypothetical protein
MQDCVTEVAVLKENEGPKVDFRAESGRFGSKSTLLGSIPEIRLFFEKIDLRGI